MHTELCYTVLLVWVAQCLLCVSGEPGDPGSCDPDHCMLPDCYCASRTGPQAVETQNIPQMVFLTFDDSVNKDNYKIYKTLLTTERKNPNGCPISATFYVSHEWTDYKIVDQLARRGHEIASHSVSHREPISWWRTATYKQIAREMGGQRKNIADKTALPYARVKGARMPYLELGSDEMYAALYDEGFTYDSSCMSGPYSQADWRNPAWPYTLDHSPSLEFCDSALRPIGNFSGFWEIPLNRWIGLDGQACPMADGCSTQTLHSNKDVLRYFVKNFERYYRKTRAPFGIHLHARWLEKEHHLDGLDKFIRILLQMNDVYFITVSQVIDWMRDATPLADIPVFQPWLTSCRINRINAAGNRRATQQPTPPTPTTTVPTAPPTHHPRPPISDTEQDGEVGDDAGTTRRGDGNSRATAAVIKVVPMRPRVTHGDNAPPVQMSEKVPETSRNAQSSGHNGYQGDEDDDVTDNGDHVRQLRPPVVSKPTLLVPKPTAQDKHENQAPAHNTITRAQPANKRPAAGHNKAASTSQQGREVAAVQGEGQVQTSKLPSPANGQLRGNDVEPSATYPRRKAVTSGSGDGGRAAVAHQYVLTWVCVVTGAAYIVGQHTHV